MIIGRTEEIKQLNRAYNSEHSEFVAVYGRRRIGKTYLIRETFGNSFTFQYSGVFNVSNKSQLKEFYNALLAQGLSAEADVPKSWFDAFRLLQELISSAPNEKKVIFIDELPWMDAPNSHFLQAFEHFWNGWASARKDILLIICGSASSWIINKILRNKGGLYNRVTYRIKLHQFTLRECEEFARHLGLSANRNMILEGYMVLGGIPYYWSLLRPDMSLAQNINAMFFAQDAVLANEFNYIYASMFNRPEKYIKVVEALCGHKSGLTRDEIITLSKLESNGQLTVIIEDLIECGFVRKYCPLNGKTRNAIYQLVDCYTLFYYHFIHSRANHDESYWLKLMSQPAYHTWCGLAFERVCLLHLRQLKAALGVAGIMVDTFSWFVKATEYHRGAQIDLILSRADNVINVCEMKYAPKGYIFTAVSAKSIEDKISILSQYVPASKGIMPVIVSSNGLISNKYSSAFPVSITSQELFG